MSYRSDNGGVYFYRRGRPGRFLFSFNQLRALYNHWEHQREGSRERAYELENDAKRLIDSGFSPQRNAYNFMENVIVWTRARWPLNDARENSHSEIKDALSGAYENVIDPNQQDLRIVLAESVEILKNLHGIGPTLASAHIRMMFPDVAGVLNQKIRDELGYGEEINDYIEFLDDLNDLKSILDPWNRSKKLISGNFRICDVEMIVYAALDRE